LTRSEPWFGIRSRRNCCRRSHLWLLLILEDLSANYFIAEILFPNVGSKDGKKWESGGGDGKKRLMKVDKVDEG
jgi:hypothetical protein